MSEEKVELDYVYAGQRRGQKGPMVVVIYTLEPGADRNLKDRMVFKASRKLTSKVVGGIYQGASFEKDGSRVWGLDDALYTGRLPNTESNQVLILDWQNKQHADQVEKRREENEKKAAKELALEDALLPARALYEQYRRQYDRVGMRALEEMVLGMLRNAPRSSEK